MGPGLIESKAARVNVNREEGPTLTSNINITIIAPKKLSIITVANDQARNRRLTSVRGRDR